jgi:hypothetical protein
MLDDHGPFLVIFIDKSFWTNRKFWPTHSYLWSVVDACSSSIWIARILYHHHSSASLGQYATIVGLELKTAKYASRIQDVMLCCLGRCISGLRGDQLRTNQTDGSLTITPGEHPYGSLVWKDDEVKSFVARLRAGLGQSMGFEWQMEFYGSYGDERTVFYKVPKQRFWTTTHLQLMNALEVKLGEHLVKEIATFADIDCELIDLPVRNASSELAITNLCDVS